MNLLIIYSRQGLNYLEWAFCSFIVIHVDCKYQLYIPGVTWMFWNLQKVDQSENSYFNLAGKYLTLDKNVEIFEKWLFLKAENYNKFLRICIQVKCDCKDSIAFVYVS